MTPEWISIKERLPELNVICRHGTEPSEHRISSNVLVSIYNHDEDNTFVEMCYFDPEHDGWQHKWERKFVTGEIWNEVTHWMPLPDPPQKGDNR